MNLSNRTRRLAAGSVIATGLLGFGVFTAHSEAQAEAHDLVAETKDTGKTESEAHPSHGDTADPETPDGEHVGPSSSIFEAPAGVQLGDALADALRPLLPE